jgi:hypothetical protein
MEKSWYRPWTRQLLNKIKRKPCLKQLPIDFTEHVGLKEACVTRRDQFLSHVNVTVECLEKSEPRNRVA